MAVGRAKRLVQNELQSRKSRLFGSDCSIPTARRQNELQRNHNNKMIRYFKIYVTSSGAKIGSYVVVVVVVVGTGGGEVNHHSLFVAHCAIVNAIRRLEGNNHTTTTTTSSQCRIRYDTIRYDGGGWRRRDAVGRDLVGSFFYAPSVWQDVERNCVVQRSCLDCSPPWN